MTTSLTERSTTATSTGPATVVRLLSLLLIAAGAVMLIAGAATWLTVQNQLGDEKITVAEDADRYAGELVDGPLTAYEEAKVIEKHSLEASGGKTYAELGREDPTRATVMNGSFLRASLFTSVVSFGVAAMAMGLGLLIAIIGYALLSLSKQLSVRS
ncbi:MAG TPA: aromatic ring-opening dioxygenase LigA [Micromonosporaceae bacterium]|nr:aromatic ring-opening dioxygenase LigA [Micromonosporaceae bacterium]